MTDKKSPNIRINKVYTRTGDGGKTRLIGGEKRWKDDARVEAYGTVDELNSEIGLCRELLKEQKHDQFSSLIRFLKSVQNELFNLGSQLAVAEDRDSVNLPHLSGDAISKLESEIDAVDFLSMIKKKLKEISLNESFIHRPVNEGFSGGEKKRNEILQMITLEPTLSILDETDSGLDIDALKIISEGIKNFRSKDNAFLLITHYYRILEYLNPDFIHVLLNGEIVKTGDKKLALKLEKEGYSWLE